MHQTEKTGIVNFVRLRSFSPFYCRYAFLDRQDYMADSLLAKRRVKVYFGEEFENEETGYQIVFCRVARKHEKKFLEAMEELARQMLMTGHSDYGEACREFLAATVRA